MTPRFKVGDRVRVTRATEVISVTPCHNAPAFYDVRILAEDGCEYGLPIAEEDLADARGPDPRDAEIARLRAENEALRRRLDSARDFYIEGPAGDRDVYRYGRNVAAVYDFDEDGFKVRVFEGSVEEALAFAERAVQGEGGAS